MMRSSVLGRAVWTLTVIFLLAGVAVPHASAAEVSSLQSILTNAPANTVYFVFPDWDSSHRKALGVGYAQVTDWTALGYVYGMFTNAPQITMLDTDTTIVDSTTGAPKLTGKVIMLFGGPLVNVLVRYYEDQGVSPLYWALVGGWSGTEHYYDRAGNSVASMTVGQIGGGSSDIALIEIFTDSAANTIVVFSGFGWHGTFTAGLYFKTIMGTPTANLAGYNKSWCLFHWTDGNGNGFPEYTEVTEEVSG